MCFKICIKIKYNFNYQARSTACRKANVKHGQPWMGGHGQYPVVAGTLLLCIVQSGVAIDGWSWQSVTRTMFSYTLCAVHSKLTGGPGFTYKCCSIQALPLIHQLPPIIPVLPVNPNLTPDLPRLIPTLEDTLDHTIAITPRPMPTSIVTDGLSSIPTKLLEKIQPWEYTDLSTLLDGAQQEQTN